MRSARLVACSAGAILVMLSVCTLAIMQGAVILAISLTGQECIRAWKGGGKTKENEVMGACAVALKDRYAREGCKDASVMPRLARHARLAHVLLWAVLLFGGAWLWLTAKATGIDAWMTQWNERHPRGLFHCRKTHLLAFWCCYFRHNHTTCAAAAALPVSIYTCRRSKRIQPQNLSSQMCARRALQISPWEMYFRRVLGSDVTS